MIPAFRSLLFAVLLVLSSTTLMAQKEIPADFCLNEQESRLATLINAHREARGMKAIPVSACLSFVARTHVLDLYNNRPDTGICNLNSWSDKGDWVSCCHNRYFPKEHCVRNKPRELTKYLGDGYELTYAEETDVVADSVFSFWSGIEEADAFLLNQGVWKNRDWIALGVGIYKNYAVIWTGLVTDYEPAPVACGQLKEERSEEIVRAIATGDVPVISSPTGRFYVVISSFSALNDARSGVKKLTGLAEGKISILKNNEGKYRISINDYATLEEAKEGKAKYRAVYGDAWILNY